MSMDYLKRRMSLSTTLLASAAQIATGNTHATAGLASVVPDCPNGLILEIDVTAAATAAGDTLDITIQTRFDGTNWVDVWHAPQILGNGGAKRYYALINAGQPQAMFTDAALTAGNQRNLIGNEWAVVWTIVNASNPSFTFSVTACCQ